MPRQPNILLLFTDMQRADTIHALGNLVIRTPALDRLVREGTAFTSCYSPSPVCVPARCSMHYGLYPVHTGLADNGPMPPDNGRSMPAELHRLGYETASIGKCHFMPDRAEARGFDSRLLQEECCSDPARDDYCRWLANRGVSCDEPHGTRGEMYYIPQISLHPAEEHPTQWIGDRTLDFLRAHRDASRPWFLFASFIHPHPPFAPPKPWHKLYRSPDMPLPLLPQNAESLHCWINRVQNRYKYRDRGRDLQLLRNIKAYYYAAISFVDFQIGRILAALDDSGLAKDTIVAFASDHGEYLGDYGCFGKRGMHDASARVPLLVRAPGRFCAGKRCETPASLVDLFPTFLHAAGAADADIPPLDGLDLAALADGTAERDFVFSQFGHGPDSLFMAVDSSHKYVYSAPDRREWLFDRVRDPQETRSVAGLPSSREPLRRLRTTLLDYLAANGAQDSVSSTPEGLAWSDRPRYDASWLDNDPDAGLLVQDHELAPIRFPEGY